MSEKLKELQNNFRITSDANSVLNELENLESIEIEDQQDDYSDETSLIFGGELEINGVYFPAPTTGFLMYLDAIDSPFLNAQRPANLEDVIQALFVMKYREQAIKDSYGIISARKYLDQYEPLIEKDPKYLEIVLKYRERFEKFLNNFKTLSSKFGDTLGIFEPGEVSEMIQEYIKACLGGFEMIQGDSNNEDKKKDLTVNG